MTTLRTGPPHQTQTLRLPREVEGLLRRVGWRMARQRAVVWGTMALGIAGASALAVSMLGMAIIVPVTPVVVLAAGTAGAAALCGIGMLLRVRETALAARLADLRLGLGERLSSALDLAEARAAATRLAPRVLADASDAARGANLREGFPIRIPKTGRWAAVLCAAALAAAVGLPGVTLPGTPARESVARVRQEGRRLEQVGKRLEQRGRTQRIPEARRAAPQVQELARRLQQERLGRAEALARLGRLGQNLEASRRQLEERMRAAGAPQRGTSDPPDPDAAFRSAQAMDRQIRQLRELSARLAQDPSGQEGRRDLEQRLNDLSQAGEGNMPAEARRKVDEARRQLQQRNRSAASQALTEALQDLEGLRSLTEDEQALAQTRRDVEESAKRISEGPPGGMGKPDQLEQGEGESAPPAPGDRRPASRPDESGAEPGKGPNEGTQPGQGRSNEKLGSSTQRLETPQERSRIRGIEGDGAQHVSEILGPGRRRPARREVAAVPVSPAVKRRADEHVVRARIPADLRSVVRRYFEALSNP